MRSSRVLFAVALTLAGLTAPARAQRGAVTGTIVSRASGESLAYGTVAIESLRREQFTTDSGRFFFGELPEGRHELLVRRLGYFPLTYVLHVRAGVTDTLRIELRRLAVPLERITVLSWPPCTSPGAPDATSNATLAGVFEQLRLNAEQFLLLSRAYPYDYTMAREVTNRLRETGKLALLFRDVQAYKSAATARYRPGQVIQRRGSASVFRIPTLAELADERFLRSHCFHYAGLDKVDSVDMIRVDLVAADAIDRPDVNGSMYLDPQSFQIRRTVLYLSKRDRGWKHLAEMRVTTDFGEILPSIPIIVEVHSVQVFDPSVKSEVDEAYEEQRMLDFRFRGRRPDGG